MRIGNIPGADECAFAAAEFLLQKILLQKIALR